MFIENDEFVCSTILKGPFLTLTDGLDIFTSYIYFENIFKRHEVISGFPLQNSFLYMFQFSMKMNKWLYKYFKTIFLSVQVQYMFIINYTTTNSQQPKDVLKS